MKVSMCNPSVSVRVQHDIAVLEVNDDGTNLLHGLSVLFYVDGLSLHGETAGALGLLGTWLQDALDKVQLAKAELANTQPAPVHAERESNETAGCYALHENRGYSCTLSAGHDGDHQAHGPLDGDPPDELIATWTQATDARIGQPIDLTDVAVPL